MRVLVLFMRVVGLCACFCFFDGGGWGVCVFGNEYTINVI